MLTKSLQRIAHRLPSIRTSRRAGCDTVAQVFGSVRFRRCQAKAERVSESQRPRKEAGRHVQRAPRWRRERSGSEYTSYRPLYEGSLDNSGDFLYRRGSSFSRKAACDTVDKLSPSSPAHEGHFAGSHDFDAQSWPHLMTESRKTLRFQYIRDVSSTVTTPTKMVSGPPNLRKSCGL